MPPSSAKARKRVDRDAELAAAFAERFVTEDEAIDVRVDAVDSGRGDYFSLGAGGHLAFTHDDWSTSVAASIDQVAHLLCQPVDELAAMLVTEIRRRATQDPLRVLRNLDADWLARQAVAEGSIDAVLGVLTPHAVDDRPHWDDARDFIFAALLEHLGGLDLTEDDEEFNWTLRRLILSEAQRRTPPGGNCEAARCPGGRALLLVPLVHLDGHCAVCALCFLGRFYLPGEHLPSEQVTDLILRSWMPTAARQGGLL